MKGVYNMEIKEFFDSNFSNILRDHSCPDHETAFKDVKERAKRMKNKESNVRQIQFKEVPVDYTEPKKSTKVLHAVAGVAGAAAVLTGAVFGLKFLNDHGGLKEGGSNELRAGYHEETTAAATMPEETVVTEQPEDEETVKSEYNFTCAPSGIDPKHFAETDVTYEFDDYSAHISGYNYDGLVLKVKYELTYKDEDIVNDPIHTSPNFYDRELMNLWNHSDMGLGARYISRNENVIEMESECLNLSVQDSFDTVLVNTREFWDNNKDLSAEEINTEFAKLAETHEKDFTAYRTVPDIPVIVRDLAEEMPTFEFSDGTTVHPTKLYLSTYGVFVYFDWIDAAAWQKILPNMQPARITLTMSDGSVVTISSGNGHGTRHDGNISGRDYVGGLFDEPIDTRNVVSVNILDEQFVTFEKETLISDIDGFEPVTVAPEENRNYLTDAHVDTDECSIDMNWLTFDGITLRLQYDVTFRNGLPADGSIPIIVACGDNEILYTTHGTRVDKLGVDENKVSYIGEVVYNRIMSGEPIKLRFRHFTREGEKELISWLDTEAGVRIITPDELPDAIIVEYEVNKDIAMKWGSKATVEKATLCRDSIMFTLKYSDLHNQGFNLHDTYLVMNDGSKVDLEGIEDQGGTASSDTAEVWQHYELSEPIDPSAVAQIYVCGECIYDAEETLTEEIPE